MAALVNLVGMDGRWIQSEPIFLCSFAGPVVFYFMIIKNHIGRNAAHEFANIHLTEHAPVPRQKFIDRFILRNNVEVIA